MSTPQEVFDREVARMGYTVARCEGVQGGCDLANRIIYIGDDVPPATRAIVGLHELGHAHTSEPKTAEAALLELLGFVSEEAHAVRYASELAAWAWAETKMPPGHEDAFEATKAHGLRSYQAAPRPIPKPEATPTSKWRPRRDVGALTTFKQRMNKT
jgi:hypothetical protein